MQLLTLLNHILSRGQGHKGLLVLPIGTAYGNQYFLSQLGSRLALIPLLLLLLARPSGMCRFCKQSNCNQMPCVNKANATSPNPAVFSHRSSSLAFSLLLFVHHFQLLLPSPALGLRFDSDSGGSTASVAAAVGSSSSRRRRGRTRALRWRRRPFIYFVLLFLSNQAFKPPSSVAR